MGERLLALTLLAASGVYLANAWPLPRGSAARPGPGFFPMAVGVFAAAVALAWVVRTFRQIPVTAAGVDAPAEGRGRVAATTAALVGFCFLLPRIGYPAAAFLFTSVMLRSLGAGWASAAVVGLASAAVSFYVFGILLGVPLPRGPFLD